MQLLLKYEFATWVPESGWKTNDVIGHVETIKEALEKVSEMCDTDVEGIYAYNFKLFLDDIYIKDL